MRSSSHPRLRSSTAVVVAQGDGECPLASGCAASVAAAELVTSICSTHNPCPPNHFCSFENEEQEEGRPEIATGHCLTCVSHNAPAGCTQASNLNEAGKADCRNMCSGTYMHSDPDLDNPRMLCTVRPTPIPPNLRRCSSNETRFDSLVPRAGDQPVPVLDTLLQLRSWRERWRLLRALPVSEAAALAPSAVPRRA